MKIIKDIEFSFGEKLDIYLPDTTNFDTIVYFHGGGIVSGSKDDNAYVEIAKDFVDKGFAFINCNYRMYPNAKYPDFLVDASNAVKFAKDNIKKYGGNGNIYISGQSAGAWISLNLCLNRKLLNNVGIDTDEIKGWIIDSSQATAHFNVIKYELNEDERKQLVNEFAPLYYVDKDTKFTKMLLIFYENDMPCRPEQNMLLYKAIKYFNDKADIEYKQLEGTHCQGSCKKDDDGRYPYCKVAMDWIERKKDMID